MKVTTVGIDLAKSVFQVHGMDERGKAVLRKQLKRAEMLKFFANLPPWLGMEACGSAHYWARKLIELGHDVRAPTRSDPQLVRAPDSPAQPQRRRRGPGQQERAHRVGIARAPARLRTWLRVGCAESATQPSLVIR